MNILYIGETKSSATAFHRAQALERLSNDVSFINPKNFINFNVNSKLKSFFHYHTGYTFLQSKIKYALKKELTQLQSKPDLVWVNSGELLGPVSMKALKTLNVPVVLYNNDDPTGGRDGNRFMSLLKAIRYYDLCAVLRVQNVAEYKQKGAQDVLRVLMSYDEIMHKPYVELSEIPEDMKSEVAFIGTWMKHENRDVFILELIKKGVPISIRGDHWNKSPYFEQLKAYWKGPAVYDRDYVAAIQGAKICLGFLSKGNRDLHTRRSVEVPFIGSLFCAERTSEHQEMYAEGVEAVFWSSAEECAALCLDLLQDPAKCEAIRLAGMQRVRKLQAGNEDIARLILNKTFNS